MRKCSRCHQEKPQDEYRLKNGRPIGSRCRQCRYELTEQWRQSEYGKKRLAIFAASSSHQQSKKLWQEKNPEKHNAHIKVATVKALFRRNGVLLPNSCEVCGAGPVHSHHPDYARPLTIQWLCPKHHKEVHQ